MLTKYIYFCFTIKKNQYEKKQFINCKKVDKK